MADSRRGRRARTAVPLDRLAPACYECARQSRIALLPWTIGPDDLHTLDMLADGLRSIPERPDLTDVHNTIETSRYSACPRFHTASHRLDDRRPRQPTLAREARTPAPQTPAALVANRQRIVSARTSVARRFQRAPKTCVLDETSPSSRSG
jgi:hypothetical protein